MAITSCGEAGPAGGIGGRLVLGVLGVMLILFPGDAGTVTVGGWDSAALEAAVQQAGPGDTVFLPAGVYTLSRPLHPRSQTQVRGAGQEETILRYVGDQPGVLMDLSGVEGVEVSHLTLDGDHRPTVLQGISAGHARHLKIHHVTVRNLVETGGWGPHGILFSGTSPDRANGVTDSEISDCLFEDIAPASGWGAAIRLAWGSSRNRVLRNVIRRTGRGGILANDGSTDLLIRGNRITGSGGEGLGIEVWVGCDRAVIEDNEIDHWLSIGGCDQCAVRRNTIRDRSGVVKFCGIEGIGNGCIVTDNLIDDGQQIGLSVSGSGPKNYFFWGYNTIRRCIQWGAQFQGEEGGIGYHYLYRCRFLGTTVARGQPAYPGDEGHGFRTNGNTHHLVFEECEFRGNGRFGLQLGGAGVDFLSFVRCRFQGNRGAAVAGPGAYHAGGPLGEYQALEWIDCTVAGNGDDTLPPAKPFPRPAPAASFTVSAEPEAGQPVTFTDTSRGGTGKIAAVLWDFGDGPPSTEPVAVHTYDRPGVYRVTLVVWDEAGRGARCEKALRVGFKLQSAKPRR